MAKKKAKKVQSEKKETKVHAKICKTCRKSWTNWIIGGVVVLVVVLLLIFYGGKKAPMPAAEVQPPMVPEEVAPTAPVGDEEEGFLIPSEVEVISEKTVYRETEMPNKFEQGSMFGGIKCSKSTGYRLDVLEFQFQNKDTETLFIDFVNPKEQSEKKAARIHINGHNLRKGVNEGCGAESVEPGQTITCKFEVPLRHYGPTGKKSANVLQIKSSNFASTAKFYC